jgi:hypothetical protein
VPAIQLAKLRKQSADLLTRYTDPAEFIRSLHELLSEYADRTHRPGQSSDPSPLLFSYGVQLTVLREIFRGIKPLLTSDIPAVLILMDRIWMENCQEFRMLAIFILGSLNSVPFEVIMDRIHVWAIPTIENRLLDALLSIGLDSVRHDYPEAFYDLVMDWLMSKNPFYWRLGFRAILPLENDLQLINLPVLFRLITPFVRNTPAIIRSDLLDVLKILIRYSPQEAAYYFQQNLLMAESQDTSRLIRQCLIEFSPELQSGLRNALRGSA